MLEAGRFVRGAGVYVDDIKIPGTLYLKIIRSPYPRAVVKSIDPGSSKPLLILMWRDIRESQSKG